MNKESLNIKVELRNPTVEEYQKLRKSTGWDDLDIEAVEKGIARSVFAVSIYYGENLAAMGRVVGDESIYFYIQDVIVLPEYQKKGLGTIVMKEIMKYIEENAPHNAFIGLMAAEGVSGFYSRYEFVKRPDSKPGMFRIWKNK